MDIDIYSYLTEEERQQIADARARIDDADAQIRDLWQDITTTEPSAEAAAAYIQARPIYADKLEDEQFIYKLELEAERRFINEHLNSTDAIVDSAKQILADVTKDQYLQWQARRTEALKQIVDARADEGDEVADFRQRAKEGSIASPDNAVMFLLQLLTTQLNACEYMQDTIANDLLWSLAEEKAAGFFENLPAGAAILPPEKAGEIIKYTRTADIKLSIDKLSYVFTGVFAPSPKAEQINGQLTMNTDSLESLSYINGEDEVTLLYSYAFDEDLLERLNMKKRIDDEDFFILSFLYNAHEAGNKTISPTKLFKDLNGRDPKGGDDKEIETLINRLRRLASTMIYINDMDVQKKWGKDTYHEGVVPLAPIYIGNERAIASGKLIKSTIRINDAPPILKVGAGIGQITTVPKEILYVKKDNGRAVSRTDRFYRILHYCIRRIAPMKDGTVTHHSILFESLYRETGEKTASGKANAFKMMHDILRHFERTGWITAFYDKDLQGGPGVYIDVPKPKQKITTSKGRKKQ